MRVFDGGSAPLLQQQAIFLGIDLFGAVGAEPDHGRARHVLVGEIGVARGRQVEAIAGKLDAIDGETLLSPGISREDEGVVIGERAAFAPDLHGNRRTAGRFHAEHAHGLEIG